MATPEPVLDDIRARRERAGISLRTLAERSGINRGRLSYLERGITPRPEEADRIRLALEGPDDAVHPTPTAGV